MTPFSSELLAATVAADLVIEAGLKVYLCYLDRSADISPLSPVEDQPVWRIILVDKVVDGSTTQYQRKYPNGLQGFLYVASQASTYTYKY